MNIETGKVVFDTEKTTTCYLDTLYRFSTSYYQPMIRRFLIRTNLSNAEKMEKIIDAMLKSMTPAIRDNVKYVQSIMAMNLCRAEYWELIAKIKEESFDLVDVPYTRFIALSKEPYYQRSIN